MMRSHRPYGVREAMSLPPADSSGNPVAVVQYGDYECKQCGLDAELLQAFRHRNEGFINFTYKHFPLLSRHRKALQAAEAAESARSQGKFWQMHNRLTANPGNLRLPDLYGYAEGIGLDMEKFTSEMDEEAHVHTIRNHIYSGTLAGVQRTPAYFVDGILVDTAGGVRSLIEVTNLAGDRQRVAKRSR